MSQKERLHNVINVYLETQNPLVEKKNINDVEILVSENVLKEVNKEDAEINFDSFILNEELLLLAQELLNQPLPNGIEKALRYAESFREILKSKNNIPSNVFHAFEPLIGSFKAYTLYKLEERGIHIDQFYEMLEGDRENRNNDLYLFEQSLFTFLNYSKMNIEKIWKICEIGFTRDPYYVEKFCIELSSKNLPLAKKLLQNILEFSDTGKQVLVAKLITGLYRSGASDLEYIFTILKDRKEVLLLVLSQVEIKREDCSQIFMALKDINDENLDYFKIKVLCQILNVKELSPVISEEGLTVLDELIFSPGKQEELKERFHLMYRVLKVPSEEKYNFLLKYLTLTKNLEVINRFFSNYEDPKYLFSLIRKFFLIDRSGKNLDDVKEAIWHFWNINRTATENEILKLFNPDLNSGFLPLKILLIGSFAALPVNILNLEEKCQIKALNAFSLFPHSIERLLPVFLSLKDSPHKRVRELLVSTLSMLIKEAYQEAILEMARPLLGESDEDCNLLQQLEEAHKSYNEHKLLKQSINDLNPFENERDLLEQFYEYDQESRALMMNKVNSEPNSLLGTFERRVIIRGNSWKMEGDNEVKPLGKISASFRLDARLYKNPELHELQLISYR